MNVNTVEDCFRERLLRKIRPDAEKTKRSLEIAEKRLADAQKVIGFPFFDPVVLCAYMCMFHAARAVLYRDGIQEKSHYAIFVYLKENYQSKIPLAVLNLLNTHRTQRHEAMYGLEFKPTKEDALVSITDAKMFLEAMKKVLEK